MANIRVFSITVSLNQDKSNFHIVHIFADIQERRIARKYVHCENVYVHSFETTMIKQIKKRMEGYSSIFRCQNFLILTCLNWV